VVGGRLLTGAALAFGVADDKKFSKTDCIRMAKTITDMSKIPISCREIVQQELQVRKAWEGATHKDRAQHAIATSGGKMGHHQLQRRLTTTTESRSR
jgi:hypothetical protein